MKRKREISYIIALIHQTLNTIFPFVLIGSIAMIIANTCFLQIGFFNQLFHIEDWLPYFKAWHYSFKSLGEMTLGMMSVFVAYKIANLHYRYRGNDIHSEFVGFTSVVSFLVITAKYSRSLFGEMTLGNLGYQHLLLAIIVGFCVASIFIFTYQFQSKKYQFLTSTRLVTALSISLLLSFCINKLWLFLQYATIKVPILDFLLKPLGQCTSFGVSILAGMIQIVSSWCGFLFPKLQTMSVNTDNLQAVMTHHTLPYPYDYFTLFLNYGVIVYMALIIATLLYSKQRHTKMMSAWCFVPTLFNQNLSFYVGMPLMMNRKYLYPLLSTAIMNMLLASLMILCHIIPTSVYPNLLGTPIIISAFITTNGNFMALAFSCLLLFIDVYWLKYLLYRKENYYVELD